MLRGACLERALVRVVVVHHPLTPEFGSCIQVELQPVPSPGRNPQPGGRGIEADPSLSRNVGFYPGVSVTGADQVAAREVVELAAAKAVHDARGNALGAQHDGHSGSEVLTMSLLAHEKEIGAGRAAWSA